MEIEFTALHASTKCEPDTDTVNTIAKAFRRYGMVVLRQCLNTDLINALQKHALSEQLPTAKELTQRNNTVTVGDRRFSQSVQLNSHIHSQALYANPIVMPLVHELLGSQHILSSVVKVMSLPGDTSQHLHRDHPPLFDKGIDKLLPPHALKLYIPLSQCNKLNGSTTFFTQSHNQSIEINDDTTGYTPELIPGDIILFDYRLHHRGTANNSQQTRQILFLSYSRHWFLDAVNFTQKNRIDASETFFKAMPEQYQYLLAWHYH